jgi:acyl carrier protein
VDDDDGEGLVVLCELTHGEDERAAEAIAAVRRAITEEYELRAHAVVMVRPGTIAKTPNGKIQRGVCRDDYLERRLVVVREWSAESEAAPVVAPAAPDDERVSTNEIERWFRQKMTAVGMDASRLRPEMGLTELGFDSVMIVELRSEIEREFGVTVQAADLFSFPTLGALARHVMERRRPQPARRAADSVPTLVERARQGKSRLQRQHLLRRGDASIPRSLDLARD